MLLRRFDLDTPLLVAALVHEAGTAAASFERGLRKATPIPVSPFTGTSLNEFSPDCLPWPPPTQR